MEFGEKLQFLRKKKGLTQEALSEILFVSRTAVSKWESGKGYPNIETLKTIARYFSVSIDELLSGEELLYAAQEEAAQREGYIRNLVFGLLDIGTIILLFLPLFGQSDGQSVNNLSLLALKGISHYLKISYFLVVILTILLGLFILIFQDTGSIFWDYNKRKFSLAINVIGTILFILSRQPYAALFLFGILIVKECISVIHRN